MRVTLFLVISATIGCVQQAPSVPIQATVNGLQVQIHHLHDCRSGDLECQAEYRELYSGAWSTGGYVTFSMVNRRMPLQVDRGYFDCNEAATCTWHADPNGNLIGFENDGMWKVIRLITD